MLSEMWAPSLSVIIVDCSMMKKIHNAHIVILTYKNREHMTCSNKGFIRSWYFVRGGYHQVILREF